jgi:hypothetical protein
MNAALASTNVVRKPADDDEKPKKKSLVLCSQHQDQVKATAERYGWTIVEFEELFGQVRAYFSKRKKTKAKRKSRRSFQAKFEKDGNQIEFEWNEEGRTSNRFQINIWDDADTGLRTSTRLSYATLVCG